LDYQYGMNIKKLFIFNYDNAGNMLEQNYVQVIQADYSRKL
jgi:hypothetical protein